MHPLLRYPPLRAAALSAFATTVSVAIAGVALLTANSFSRGVDEALDLGTAEAATVLLSLSDASLLVSVVFTALGSVALGFGVVSLLRARRGYREWSQSQAAAALSSASKLRELDDHLTQLKEALGSTSSALERDSEEWEKVRRLLDMSEADVQTARANLAAPVETASKASNRLAIILAIVGLVGGAIFSYLVAQLS